MGFFNKLEEVRKKPEAARRKLLFVWMTISMTVVIIIWLGILRMDNNAENEEDINAPNPFEILKNNFQSSKDQIKDSLK